MVSMVKAGAEAGVIAVIKGSGAKSIVLLASDLRLVATFAYPNSMTRTESALELLADELPAMHSSNVSLHDTTWQAVLPKLTCVLSEHNRTPRIDTGVPPKKDNFVVFRLCTSGVCA